MSSRFRILSSRFRTMSSRFRKNGIFINVDMVPILYKNIFLLTCFAWAFMMLLHDAAAGGMLQEFHYICNVIQRLWWLLYHVQKRAALLLGCPVCLYMACIFSNIILPILLILLYFVLRAFRASPFPNVLLLFACVCQRFCAAVPCN